MSTSTSLFNGFQSHRVKTPIHNIRTEESIELHVLTGGKKNAPALLLLHGFPQTHAIWHKIIPHLVDHFFLVLPDLRGYGDSAKPPGGTHHIHYSKQVMASDQMSIMKHFNYQHFFACGHDRGARVLHRLCLDYPEAVDKAMFLDIAPTLAMYEGTTQAFATAYWHWFFLIQPEPLPENIIQADPEILIRWMQGRIPPESGVFTPEAINEYRRCQLIPGAIHGYCEDYRAAANIDLEHDRANRTVGERITCPIEVLWGKEGVIEKCFQPLSIWKQYAHQVQGEALPCGHYIPEECPELLAKRILHFFGNHQ